MITFAEEVMCLSRFAGLFVCEHSYSKSCGWIFCEIIGRDSYYNR